MVALLLLEPVARELQRAAVFGHGADNVVRCAGRNLRFDFQSHLHYRADKASYVCHNFVGDAPGVSTDTRGVKRDASVKPLEGRRRVGATFVPPVSPPATGDVTPPTSPDGLAASFRCGGCFGCKLSLGNFRTDKDPEQTVFGDPNMLTGAKTAITARRFVKTLGICKRVLHPGQQAKAAPNGFNEHAGVL